MIEVVESCQQYRGLRLARVPAHCSDKCGIDLTGRHRHGYVPRGLGISGGNDIHCVDGGQVHGQFSLPPTAIGDGRD